MTGSNGNQDENGMEKQFCMLTGKKQSLADLIDFPADYTFKIMGKTRELVIDDVIAQMEEVIGRTIMRNDIRVRPSKGDKYTSYSVHVLLQTAEELTAIYSLLQKETAVIYYL